MNKFIGLGRITRDIELKVTSTGKKCCQFTLAVPRPKAKGAAQAQSDFISCVAWEHNAEFASKYFAKGSQILVEGRVSTRNYEKNGQKVYVTEIVCDHFDFAGPRPQQQAGPADSFGVAPAAGDEDIPW